MNEQARILAEYERREREMPSDYYACYHPANLFIRQGQEAAVLQALYQAQRAPLQPYRLLDVGCGIGEWLGVFQKFGASSANLAGIELGAERLAEARTGYPSADLRTGNAAQLPWQDAAFDIVFQATVFTSILDPEMKQTVAAEMRRVLKPSGAIIWLDFQYNNPRNPSVRGVPAREIRRLFPDCRVRTRRITLAPPLTRRVVPWSWKLATFLELLTLFNTHLIAVIQPHVRSAV